MWENHLQRNQSCTSHCQATIQQGLDEAKPTAETGQGSCDALKALAV